MLVNFIVDFFLDNFDVEINILLVFDNQLLRRLIIIRKIFYLVRRSQRNIFYEFEDIVMDFEFNLEFLKYIRFVDDIKIFSFVYIKDFFMGDIEMDDYGIVFNFIN